MVRHESGVLYRADLLRAMDIIHRRITADPDRASPSMLKQVLRDTLGDPGYVQSLSHRGVLVPAEGRTRAFQKVYTIDEVRFRDLRRELMERIIQDERNA